MNGSRRAELLRLHGRLCGVSPEELRKRVPELIDLVGLTAAQDKRSKNFSKGMLQRIGLAQALIHEPELIFLDEPTSGLDPLGRRLVRDIIRAQRDRGATVFLNSHLLSEIEITCDQVVFIREGEVVTSRDLRTVAGRSGSRGGARAQSAGSGCGAARALGNFPVSGRGAAYVHRALSANRCLRSCAAWWRPARRSTSSRRSRMSLEELFVSIMGEDRRHVNGTWIMAGITFREAARKKMLWTALLAGAGFLVLFGDRLAFPDRRFQPHRRAAVFALPGSERDAHDRALHGGFAGSGHDHAHVRGHDRRRNYLRHDSRHRHQAHGPLADSDRQMDGIRRHAGVYVAIMFGGTIADGL